jgi:hypothetical protein
MTCTVADRTPGRVLTLPASAQWMIKDTIQECIDTRAFNPREDLLLKLRPLNLGTYQILGVHEDVVGPVTDKITKIQKWYKDKKLHNVDGAPAVVHPNGRKEWYKSGLRHRGNDLPAVEDPAAGVQEWWVSGKRHRDEAKDSPAYINNSNGVHMWFVNGFLHRHISAPAVKGPHGLAHFYHDGIRWIMSPAEDLSDLGTRPVTGTKWWKSTTATKQV